VSANGGAPLDPAIFTVGSIESTTANLFDTGGVTVSHAESTLNGVRLMGGLMTIDSITSISDVHYDATGNAVGTSSTTVQGAKMLGQPVTIDDKGVHPDGNSQVDPSLLTQAGLSVRLVGATQGAEGQFWTAQSQGVEIGYTRTVDNAPQLPSPPPNPITQTSPALNGTYFVRYNLATVSSKALARNLTFGSGGTGGTGGSSLTTSPLSPNVAAPSGFTGATASAPAASLQAPTDDSTNGTSVGFLGLDAGKMKLLYLAFTLTALGVCLVPRLALPARLPGPLKG
jgi:hypothetical protein